MGGSPRRRSRSARPGRIMIAKPSDPTRRWSTKCQPPDGGATTGTETVAAMPKCPLENGLIPPRPGAPR